MKGFNPNARDRQLKTPLFVAATKGHELICDVLVKYGGDLLTRDCQGRSPLHYACLGFSASLITLMIGMKPELIDLADNEDLFPLHFAVLNQTQK